MTIPNRPTAREATVCVFTPFHPAGEKKAEEVFGKVVRPGQDGMSVEDCLKVCDGIREYTDLLILSVYLLHYRLLYIQTTAGKRVRAEQTPKCYE